MAQQVGVNPDDNIFYWCRNEKQIIFGLESLGTRHNNGVILLQTDHRPLPPLKRYCGRKPPRLVDDATLIRILRM